MDTLRRRTFLKFLGMSTGYVLAGLPEWSLAGMQNLPFTPLAPSGADAFTLANGFTWSRLLTWEDNINARGETFGFNNDYIAFVPLEKGGLNDGLLLVNHEYPDPKFVSGRMRADAPTRTQVMLEQYSVGMSIVRITREASGLWRLNTEGDYNRRISGQTPLPFAWDIPIGGAFTAIGTVGNCAGGVTPWGTILSCEENYHVFYGENVRGLDGKYTFKQPKFRWTDHYPYDTRHYGWVLEVDPFTGKARKLVSLGRIEHECATFARALSGKAVIYTGEDAEGECLYRFISDTENSLDRGEMFVANLEAGEWISLDLKKQPELQKVFGNQTDVLIHMRDAAKIVGGTPLDRPEDIEINPHTGEVIIALTNNKSKGNYFGSILKISPEGKDHGSQKFTSEILISGGPDTGFAAPDNLAFDANGNLWMTTDMSEMHKDPYKSYGNNSLFVIPASGENAGIPLRVANAPIDAELTGPCFSPDGKTLFLSVQHPGEASLSTQQLSSHWPEGGSALPRPAVVAIQGPALEFFTQGE